MAVIGVPLPVKEKVDVAMDITMAASVKETLRPVPAAFVLYYPAMTHKQERSHRPQTSP